jgi:transposase
MMGHRSKRFKLFTETNLEALLPADNFYRQLEGKLDLSFVRDLVRDLYGEIGRRSIDPVVFFKLQLIAFFEGITSERRLMETAQLNLAHRWYLGYDLDEPLPDHSSLSKIRSRYGVETFQRFFERIVELCMEAGLVEGDELYIDATKVEADASISSLRPRLSLAAAQEHVRLVFEEDPAPREQQPQSVPSSEGDGLEEAVTSTGAKTQGASFFRSLIEGYRHARRGLLWGKKNYVRTADFRVSRTDPDAKPMRAGGSKAKLGYHDQYVVDGGRARIILATLVTSASVMENSPMLDLVRWLRFRWHLLPHQATGDKAYATLENIKGLEDDGIKAYMPLPNWSRRPGFYGQEQFTYLPERDVYVCPQGQELTRRKSSQRSGAHFYRAAAGVCQACPVLSACTSSSRGRTIRRPFDQEYVERVRRYHDTEPCLRAIRKRQAWVEPLFAEAKTRHGLRRFHLRGIEKVNMEGLMIASGQNLKRFLKYSGTGPVSQTSALLTSVFCALRRTLLPAAHSIARPAPAFAT